MARGGLAGIGRRVMGGAALLALVAAAFGTSVASADFSDYGLESSSISLSTTQAGAHPDVQLGFKLKTDPSSPADPTGLHEPYARTENVKIELPPGLLGNPNSIARCSPQQFASFTTKTGEGCPLGSQVGVVNLHLYGFSQPLVEPIYNMEPQGDETVARLGFYAATLPNFVNITVRAGTDYGLTAAVEGIPASERLVEAVTELWGIPADSSHNTMRLTPEEGYPKGKTKSPSRSSGVEPAPFMSNPTTCGTSLAMTVRTNSYQLPEMLASSTSQLPVITGCNSVQFSPSLNLTPTSTATASPSGLDAELSIPQNEAPEGQATSALRTATVKLPVGLSIATSAADGLQACSANQVRYMEEVESNCPEASKIGSAEFDVPPLSRILKGEIYQRTPEPGHLFRIWLVTDELGVHVKIPGEIETNGTNGQVTSVFVDTPQVPLKSLKLHFKGGPRGVIATPASCGTYYSEYDFSPWSGGLPVVGRTPFVINEDCGTGGFSPGFVAGATNAAAGATTHFAMNLVRNDGEQNVSAVDVSLPRGLLAKLSGVPLCEGDAASTATCSPGSEVGTVTVSAGPGSNPLWVPQAGREPTAVFLSGPYKGAPYSLVIKVPAQAGPFDLGTVVTRAGIYVDPSTTQVTVKSDPLPQILEGVPISYRTIHVQIDRADFMINPTNCEPTAVEGTIGAANGASASVFSSFQVGGCRGLKFEPKLNIQLKGSGARLGHPALKAVLTAKPGEANIARAQVNLPHGEFLDQGNLNKTCTRPVLLAGNCPASTVYGHAKAWSPLLGAPLEGPVYLVGGYGYKLPALVAELNGQIRVLLVGKVDSGKNKGIRNTFEVVPDAPVSRFVLQMKGGKKYGLLENSENLCTASKADRRAIVRFTGQNGKVDAYKPVVSNQCGKKKPHKKKHASHKTKAKGGGGKTSALLQRLGAW